MIERLQSQSRLSSLDFEKNNKVIRNEKWISKLNVKREEGKKLTFRSINWIQQEWPLIGFPLNSHYQLTLCTDWDSTHFRIADEYQRGREREWLSLKKLKRFNIKNKKKNVGKAGEFLLPIFHSLQFNSP